MNTDRAVAYALALTPLLTLNFSYALAVMAEYVPACVPYLTGCTSSSSTGRPMLPKGVVFLPGMLTTALLTVLFWRRCAARLESVPPAAVARWLGLAAGLSLAAYAVSVGQQHDAFRATRSWGIAVYMHTHYAAQILFLLAWWRSALPKRGLVTLLVICILFPVLGVGAEIVKHFGLERHTVNNVVEWNAIALASLYFALTGYFFFASRPGGRAASPRE